MVTMKVLELLIFCPLPGTKRGGCALQQYYRTERARCLCGGLDTYN